MHVSMCDCSRSLRCSETGRPRAYAALQDDLIAQFLAVCSRSKVVSMGTRRPRRGSRLCSDEPCNRRGDTQGCSRARLLRSVLKRETRSDRVQRRGVAVAHMDRLMTLKGAPCLPKPYGEPHLAVAWYLLTLYLSLSERLISPQQGGRMEQHQASQQQPQQHRDRQPGMESALTSRPRSRGPGAPGQSGRCMARTMAHRMTGTRQSQAAGNARPAPAA